MLFPFLSHPTSYLLFLPLSSCFTPPHTHTDLPSTPLLSSFLYSRLLFYLYNITNSAGRRRRKEEMEELNYSSPHHPLFFPLVILLPLFLLISVIPNHLSSLISFMAAASQNHCINVFYSSGTIPLYPQCMPAPQSHCFIDYIDIFFSITPSSSSFWSHNPIHPHLITATSSTSVWTAVSGFNYL